MLPQSAIFAMEQASSHGKKIFQNMMLAYNKMEYAKRVLEIRRKRRFEFIRDTQPVRFTP